MKPAMARKKPIAVFDIDGTIFRSSLLIEFNALLVQKGIFPASATRTVEAVRQAWINRQGSYQAYIDTIVRLYLRDIKGTSVRRLRQITQQVIQEQKHKVYVFTRDLIRKLRKSHQLAIISFSPSEVVEEFRREYRFGIAQGIAYEHKKGKYTGRISPGTVFDKKAILLELVERHGLSLKGSIGVGDTETDADFLHLVENPIAFNPNQKLYRIARREKWPIVVERKDVMYHL